MPSDVLKEGKVFVCITGPVPAKPASSVIVVERRWVVLKNEKLKVYDKKMNISRKKIFSMGITQEIKEKGGVYSENADTRELYFLFPDKLCIFRFRQVIQFTEWSTTCKSVFSQTVIKGPISPRSMSVSNPPPPTFLSQSPPPANPPLPTKPSHLSASIDPNNNNNNNTNDTNNQHDNKNKDKEDRNSKSKTLKKSKDHAVSNSNLRHTVAVSAPSLVSPQPTIHHTHYPPIEIKPVVHPAPLDLATVDDVALLKKEILYLRRKVAICQEERDSLQAILAVEKDFVRDRQNKLDSWEHFARIVVFKALCNQSKNEKLKAMLNNVFETNLPAIKSVKISRMEVTHVNLPTEFEESPNFGLSSYDETTGIGTFNFKWYPQNCNIILQIDGQKKIGGAIPINFKVSIDLLSKLKIKGDLMISKGEGNQFLISLSRLPELTFAMPSKLQIGDVFDVSSFAIVQKVVESAVFSGLKKHLVHPVWKDVQF